MQQRDMLQISRLPTYLSDGTGAPKEAQNASPVHEPSDALQFAVPGIPVGKLSLHAVKTPSAHEKPQAGPSAISSAKREPSTPRW